MEITIRCRPHPKLAVRIPPQGARAIGLRLKPAWCRDGYHNRVSGGSPAARRSPQPVYEIEFYETPDGDQPARRWLLEELTPSKRRAIGTAMNHILAQEGVNVCETEWGKALGKGLYEFRLRDEIQEQGVTEKILLRVFFHPYGNKIILLLGGYDKGEDSSSKRQHKEIAEARRRLDDFRDQQRRRRPISASHERRPSA